MRTQISHQESKLALLFFYSSDETLASISPSSTTDSSRTGVAIHDSIISLQRTLTLLTSTNLRIPVIAAVHGHCIGLGIDILAACDVRLAAEGSSFCIKVFYFRTYPFYDITINPTRCFRNPPSHSYQTWEPSPVSPTSYRMDHSSQNLRIQQDHLALLKQRN